MNSDDSMDRRRPENRMPSAWRRDLASMATVMIAGVIGLTWFSFRVTSPDRAISAEDRLERIGIDHIEVLSIFVPKAFIELTAHPSEVATLESHDDITKYLHQRGLEKAWYALNCRVFQSDGKVLEAASYCRPHDLPWKRPEFLAVLDVIQGNATSHQVADYSHANLVIIPDELANGEPGPAIAELLRLANYPD